MKIIKAAVKYAKYLGNISPLIITYNHRAKRRNQLSFNQIGPFQGLSSLKLSPLPVFVVTLSLYLPR